MRLLLLTLITGALLSCNSKHDAVAEKHNVYTDTVTQHLTVYDTIDIPARLTNTVQNEPTTKQDSLSQLYDIIPKLPEWLLESNILKGLELNKKYNFDGRLNPLYLEADFNNDGHIDIALSVTEKETGKVGFAIIHGNTKEIFIIGAGTKIKKSWSDDFYYIDVWKVNRKKTNEPGVGENDPLIMDFESLQIENSDIGGGLIYWNGLEYQYFHQTC